MQKSASKVILGRNFLNYKNALKVLNLDKLHERRKKICLNFAKNCLKNDKVKDLFPKNDQTHKMNLRKQKKYKVKKIRTERYKKSALPYMQNLLNIEELKKRKEMKER